MAVTTAPQWRVRNHSSRHPLGLTSGHPRPSRKTIAEVLKNEAISHADYGPRLYFCDVRNSCHARKCLLVGQGRRLARRPVTIRQRRKTFRLASLDSRFIEGRDFSNCTLGGAGAFGVCACLPEMLENVAFERNL